MPEGKRQRKRDTNNLTLGKACQPAAFGALCDPQTYEASPSPYDYSTAQNDSHIVIDTAGAPPGTYMMSGADGGYPWTGQGYPPYTQATGGYADTQPSPYPGMETGYDHAVASSSRTDAGSGLVSQQPPQHASMGYYDDDPADETESLLPQQDYGTIGDSGSSSSHGNKGKGKGKAKAKARHRSHNHDMQDRNHDEHDRSHDRSRR